MTMDGGKSCWTGETAIPRGTPVLGSAPRYVILLDGLKSQSLSGPGDHGVRDDFALLRRRCAAADPSLRIVYFSYRAGVLLAAAADPHRAWASGRYEQASEPRYRSSDTTDHPLVAHVTGLDWLVSDILTRHPGARLDLIGFSLGGIVALDWVARQPAGPGGPLAAVHRVVLLDAPVGGITPLARLAAAPLVRDALLKRWGDFGTGTVLQDLIATSPTIARLPSAVARVDLASVENSRDYVVNGARLPVPLLPPRRLRAITIGRGATLAWPGCPSHPSDLGEVARDLCGTHTLVLRGTSTAVARAHHTVIRLITGDGLIWTSRRTDPGAGRPAGRFAHIDRHHGLAA